MWVRQLGGLTNGMRAAGRRFFTQIAGATELPDVRPGGLRHSSRTGRRAGSWRVRARLGRDREASSDRLEPAQRGPSRPGKSAGRAIECRQRQPIGRGAAADIVRCPGADDEE